MKNSSKVDLSYKDRALKALLIPARHVSVVTLSSFLRRRESYSLELANSIYYSMLNPPQSRYWYAWLRSTHPSIDVEGRALHVFKGSVMLIDYTELYKKEADDSAVSRMKKEILLMLRSGLDEKSYYG